LANAAFPPELKYKIEPLQLAYQAHKDSLAMESLMKTAIITYFEVEGLTHFNKLLTTRPFISNDWSPGLMRMLVSHEIIINEDPVVEATIRDGKIYWCIVFENQIYFRRPTHESIISHARAENRTWRLTWEKFREFKDAGKRTGTVAVTEERFVNRMLEHISEHNERALGSSTFKTINISPKEIWQELSTIGILDKKLRLSQSWYPFSNEKITLLSIKSDGIVYKYITKTLYEIANNSAYKESINFTMDIYRPARVSKEWAKTGRITNNKLTNIRTEIWDVGVYRELKYHAVNNVPYEIDHIPSQSKIMDLEHKKIWDPQKSVCEKEIGQIIQNNNSRNLRKSTALSEERLKELKKQKELIESTIKEHKEGLSFWGIYIDKELHKKGDTNGTSRAGQEGLSFYTSVKKHIDNLKEDLQLDKKEDPISLLQALGALRYMYSRMCKPQQHIAGHHFISETPGLFFSPQERMADRRQMDDFFVQEMQSIRASKF